MSSNRQKEKEETEKLKEMLPTEAEKKEIEKLAAEKIKKLGKTLTSLWTKLNHQYTRQQKKQKSRFHNLRRP
jgi:hypothetical protein